MNDILIEREGYNPILLCGMWGNSLDSKFKENCAAPILIRYMCEDRINMAYHLRFRDMKFLDTEQKMLQWSTNGVDCFLHMQYIDDIRKKGIVLFTLAKPDGFRIIYCASYPLDFEPAKIVDANNEPWRKYLLLGEGDAKLCGTVKLQEITNQNELIEIKNNMIKMEAEVLDNLFRLQMVPEDEWEWNPDRMD